MHKTIAFSGGSRYKPTTSISFSLNRGSLLILNVSTRCGCRPSSDQYPLHRRRADPDPLRHRPARPVSMTRRCGLGGQLHDLGDLLLTDHRLATTTLLHRAPTSQSVGLERRPPGPHRYRSHPVPSRRSLVADAIAEIKKHPRPQHLTVRRRTRVRHLLQHLPLGRRDNQRSSSKSHTNRIQPNGLFIYETHHEPPAMFAPHHLTQLAQPGGRSGGSTRNGCLAGDSPAVDADPDEQARGRHPGSWTTPVRPFCCTTT